MENRPNIIILVSHDLGKHLGCYGVAEAGTPCLDSFAREGIRFDRFFSTSPQCSPARASLFTGRYPHSHGVIGLCSERFGFDLNPGEKHLAAILHESGYKTRLAGIQHETLRMEELPFEALPVENNCCDRVAAAITRFLGSQSAAGAPFYLQGGFFEAHRPFEKFGTPAYTENGIYLPPWIADEATARDDFAAFQGSIHRMDSAVGTILESLEKTGLADNTLVVFLADHGIPFPRAKHTLYEPGCETTVLMRWPAGGWEGGKSYRELLCGVDLLPTLLDMLGIAVPSKVQGRSFKALLNGEAHEASRAVFTEQNYHAYTDVSRAVRTETHKLIANFSPGRSFYDSTQLWRPLTQVSFIEDQPRTQHPCLEFYDLESDAMERTNLAGSDEHAGELGRLAALLKEWMQDTEDPLLQGIPPPPIHGRTMGKINNLTSN